MQEQDKKLLELFGNRLKQLREQKYKSLNNFAFNYSLVSSATISRIENANVDFKFSTLIKIANALNISASELLENFNFNYNNFDN